MATSQQLSKLAAVIGTTGVGKSLLGVELARALQDATSGVAGAEVLNHDSMQVYRGLDVITNKATEEEMQGVPHYLMGFLSPGEEYSVGAFQEDALAKIQELESRSTLPIAVGGTTYYLQNLIFPNQLVADVPPIRAPSPPPTSTPISKDRKSATDIASFPPSLRDSVLSLPVELLYLFYALPSLPATSTPSEFPPAFPIDLVPGPYRTPETFTPAIYAILKHVDPASADRWHWRDIRKVRRALEIVWEGRRWEDVTALQQEKRGEGVRFRTLIFWLYAENEVLHPRLDARVDKMLELGLMSEINELWTLANGPDKLVADYSKGIFQAIGYKEFEAYLAARSSGVEADSAQAQKLFKEGLENMKTSTRQYAKRQVKWIKSKLLPAVRELESDEVTVVLLDATDLAEWSTNVRDPAVRLLRAFLQGEELPDPSSLSATAAKHLAPPAPQSTTATVKRVCDLCTTDTDRPFVVEERQWEAHAKSKNHRRLLQIKSGFYKGGRPRPVDPSTA